VVSFHSLEDRLVKTFLTARARAASPSRHQPDVAKAAPTFALRQKKALAASDEEVHQNPRARSARLRVAVRTDAAIPHDDPLAGLMANIPSLDRSRRR
jgi:16S rRNA (cytosine1402-N4)-methyltransferase